MQDDRLAKAIAAQLEASSQGLDAAKLARLHAARTRAMVNMREPVRVLGLMTVSGRLLEPVYLVRQPLFWLPLLVAVALGITAYQANVGDDLYDQAGTIDAKILSAELPLEALLDKDFAEWITESSSQQ